MCAFVVCVSGWFAVALCLAAGFETDRGDRVVDAVCAVTFGLYGFYLLWNSSREQHLRAQGGLR